MGKSLLKATIEFKARLIENITGIKVENMLLDGTINELWQGRSEGSLIYITWKPFKNIDPNFKEDYFQIGLADEEAKECSGFKELKELYDYSDDSFKKFLAAELDQYAKDYDPYEYADRVDSSEENILQIYQAFQSCSYDCFIKELEEEIAEGEVEESIYFHGKVLLDELIKLKNLSKK